MIKIIENGKEYYVDSDSGFTKWYDLYLNLHREDGPAIIYPYPLGSKYWFKHGQLHRENGPAVIYPDGVKKWYLNDKVLSKKQFLEIQKDKIIDLDGTLYLKDGRKIRGL